MKALIFDCDGTLVDSHPLHLEAMQQAGIPITKDFYHTRNGLTLGALLQELQLDPAPVKKACAEHFLTIVPRLRTLPAADLARAFQGPMAVASNGHRDVVEASLEATGLRQLFQTVVTLDDVPQGKPAPDLFLEAARRLGVQPSECLVFEDSEQGLEAARRAGITACDVRRAS